MPPRPDAAPITDVRQSIPTELSHAVRRIVLVVPYLAKIPLERMRERTGFPGTRQIPAAQTMRGKRPGCTVWSGERGIPMMI
jgi:hypothetical protein